MKSILFVVAFCATFFAFPAFATEVDASLVPPDWLAGLLIWLQSMPYVGPVLATIFKWIGVVSAVFTALSVAAQVIFALPEVAARFAGAPALAEKIKYWSDKILYWLKFFSIRNAQK
jgi:hypothetical protein